MLLNGLGATRDEVKAADYLGRAAGQNYAQAQTLLGALYLQGRGVRQGRGEGHRSHPARRRGRRRGRAVRDGRAARRGTRRAAEGSGHCRPMVQGGGRPEPRPGLLLARRARRPREERRRGRRPGGARVRRAATAPASTCSVAPTSKARAGCRGTRRSDRAGSGARRTSACPRRRRRSPTPTSAAPACRPTTCSPTCGSTSPARRGTTRSRCAMRWKSLEKKMTAEQIAEAQKRSREWRAGTDLADAIARAAPGAPPAGRAHRARFPGAASLFRPKATSSPTTMSSPTASASPLRPEASRRRSSRATCATISRC